MSHPEKDRLESEIDLQQTEIEHIETQICLKDASVATEGEVRHLQTAQQVHRDNIHDLEKALREQKP
ncbi:hypothetical protein [Granulicella sp. S190]|uniref:hypothetical protein n=1 Tax=Granulicella sp. S190 TaxID=1747226 RepID=UPI00131E2DC3|nr:hypothetical protein [Granulicella sp. S190]